MNVRFQTKAVAKRRNKKARGVSRGVRAKNNRAASRRNPLTSYLWPMTKQLTKLSLEQPVKGVTIERTRSLQCFIGVGSEHRKPTKPTNFFANSLWLNYVPISALE